MAFIYLNFFPSDVIRVKILESVHIYSFGMHLQNRHLYAKFDLTKPNNEEDKKQYQVKVRSICSFERS
jgi:hypothetical protein